MAPALTLARARSRAHLAALWRRALDADAVALESAFEQKALNGAQRKAAEWRLRVERDWLAHATFP
jgi:hypothetical protein